MNNENKRKNLLIVLLLIIALLSIVTTVYFSFKYYDYKLEKCSEVPESEKCNECPEVEECEECESSEDSQELKATIIDERASGSGFLFPENQCAEKYPYTSNFIREFYGSGIKLEEFSKNDLIKLAIDIIGPIPVCSNKSAVIDLKTINLALKLRFNYPNLEITLDDLKKYSGSSLGFSFDENNIHVVSSNCDGCGPATPGSSWGNYIKKIEKKELNGNKLYIYYRVSYVESKGKFKDDQLIGRYTVTYKASDIDKKIIIEEFEDENEAEDNINWSKYTLYKATYELVDTALYFRSNEIIEK